MHFLRQSLMKSGLSMRKIDRVLQQYPLENSRAQVCISPQPVNIAGVWLTRYGDPMIVLNPEFVDWASKQMLAFVLAHEQAHFTHKDLFPWQYFVACKELHSLSQAPSLLTLSLAFMRYLFPRDAFLSSKPSMNPVFLFSRSLMRKTEMRADRTAINDSLELCQGAIAFFETLDKKTKKPSFMGSLVASHPSIQTRLQNARAQQADLIIAKSKTASL